MEKHLLKTTEDLQGFVRINLSVLRQSFLPYEFDAQHKFIARYLGQELHSELLLLYNGDEYPGWADSEYKKGVLRQVLYHCQNALAMFTMYLAAPHMDLHLSEMGFVVTHSQNAAPASAQRVKTAVDAFLDQGYDRLEVMLRFLEKHHGVIASYGDSDAYVLENAGIINSAAEFDQILPLSLSRIRFIALRQEMQSIRKLVIEPIISEEFFSELVEQKQKLELSQDNKSLLSLLQHAMAYMAVAGTLNESNAHYHLSPMKGEGKDKALSRETILAAADRFAGYGRNYLAGVKKLLRKHPDKYPTYKHSQQYHAESKNQAYENTESKVFVFGQPSLEH